ncbi:MAG: potassium channel family protein [Armatimonadota bacterium]
MKKSFLVIGMGVFGSSVATRLAELGHEVLGVDTDPAVIQHMSEVLTQAIQMDATDIDNLRTLGVPNFDVCIVGRGTKLDDSVLITMNLKELGAKYIVAKALSEAQAKILKALGVDRIVFPERDMGIRMAQMLVAPRMVDHMDLATNYGIDEIAAPPELVGKTLGEAKFRSRYRVNVVCIKRGDQINPVPDNNDVIQEGDVLVVIGENRHLRALRGE